PAARDAKNCTCQSACFLIFVGGVHRGGNIIGVHRVYLRHDILAKMNPSEAQASSNLIRKSVLAYLDEMGVPSSYNDKLLSVPSERMEYLDESEIKQHFSGYITDYSEWVTAKCGNWNKDYKKAAYLQQKANDGNISTRERKELDAINTFMEKALE